MTMMKKFFNMTTDENAFQNARAFQRKMKENGHQTRIYSNGLGACWCVVWWE